MDYYFEGMLVVTQHLEREIFEKTCLCDPKGNLNPQAIGFARRPLFDCNLKGHFMRKKRWNQWCMYGEDILFSVTLFHFDYSIQCFVYFLEYETLRFVEKTVTVPLGLMSRLKMPEQVLEPVRFSNSEMNVNITLIQNQTLLTVNCDNFDSEPLNVNLSIQHPTEDETLNVVVPWNRQTFQFTAKHVNLPTKGFVKLGSKRYDFNEEECFSVLNFGRGVMPKNIRWHWANASQRLRGKRVGINFGGKWTDGTGMTENAIFIDGKMTKIHEDVLFEYDSSNISKPWYITTKFSDTVMLSFHPFFKRENITKGKLNHSETHQLVGYYNGKVKLEDGSTLVIQQMLGCIVEQIAKW